MYPEFLEIAKQEKNKQAEWSFNVANQVEQIHAKLFKKAQTGLKNEEKLEEVDYYVCKVCGNTVENSAPDKCPICAVPSTQFFKVE
jgi:rubrerythrin